MTTKAPQMSATGFSVAETERILGLSLNDGYRQIKLGKLRAFRNSQNLLKVTEAEIYRFMREEL